MEQKVQCKALFNFAQRVNNELTFNEGDIITLIEKHESGMWKGELDGRIGLFPYNFVAEIQDGDNPDEQIVNLPNEGWLTKQGHIRKNWKRRWFSLRGNQLFYYAKPEITKESGIIPLAQAKVEDADSVTQKSCSFHIFYPHESKAKDFYVYADNAVEKSAWCKAIENASKI
ncbi:MAG: hypothetical protein EZS28_012749 [Streblomastix strix]|uniref:PH domain-containing protein n=1 Tax=Streblomastix strix TaxID=222440 RepID=A0A5J4WB16_9EUKA|nr:MAG: hypothetical protein EZS28_012749 [Streblomastix strix]